ncbi:hypothetical protein PABG_12103 [Paracoccidioides brasiliensis Pb03]|nr:hypothetical protein PABG_12103 [Paracoccidioides brasiliensis Pb03]
MDIALQLIEVWESTIFMHHIVIGLEGKAASAAIREAWSSAAPKVQSQPTRRVSILSRCAYDIIHDAN